MLLVSSCPVHSGDNVTAFNINIGRTEFRGRWFCNTCGCHKKYGGDLLGLIHGLMTAKAKTNVDFIDVLNLAHTFCGTESFDYVSDAFTDILLRDIQKQSTGETRQSIRYRLTRPARFYLDRGFSEDVLDIFDVGVCRDPYDEMHDRVVFPIYEPTGNLCVGSVGRTIVESTIKWKNQKGFHKSEYLYGYWLAIQPVCQTGKIILVEGQGDVLRFFQAGVKNVVGIFGSKLSDTQELLLQKTGCMNVITVFDKDDAGNKCRLDCDRLKKLFNVRHVIPQADDVGEMSVDQINSMKVLL
jgi:DNA primase